VGNLQHYLLTTKVDWRNISLLDSVQRLVETNIHQSLVLAFAYQFYVRPIIELSKQFLSEKAQLLLLKILFVPSQNVTA